MYFVDFEKYKIIKDFNYTTKEFSLLNNDNDSILTINEQVNALVSGIVDKEPLSVHYIINFINNSGEKEDDPDTFLGLVNITLKVLFDYLITKDERKTEYRLDVPEKLKGLHMSYSILKKACNRILINNKINITVNYKNFTFSLCDGKDLPEEQEFVHSVDELEK